MNILIAPDSFKESLSAKRVASSLEEGLKKASAKFEIKKFPMADGGEGTVQSLVAATQGRIINQIVTGPLGEEIEAYFGILGDHKTAVIEMAVASGLPLVPVEKRNPAQTTTYGTGELIKAALDGGCNKLIIGIGGSATNDCGVGMAQALGGKFLDDKGKEVGFGGGQLENIERIDLSGLDPRIKEVEIEVACDVGNPLYGEQGAAYVYAPQKGATSAMVEKLDEGLRHLAKKIKQDLNIRVDKVSGAGAAGGLGAGLLAFLNAKLKSGVEIVIEASRIEEEIKVADLVITGEGMIDGQTICGKTPIGVAKVAKKYNVPVVGVAGSLGKEADKVHEYGIDALFSILNAPMTLDAAIENSAEMLVDLGENIGRMLIVNKSI